MNRGMQLRSEVQRNPSYVYPEWFRGIDDMGVKLTCRKFTTNFCFFFLSSEAQVGLRWWCITRKILYFRTVKYL